MIEQTLIPSPGVIELNPDTIHMAVARLGNVMGTVWERYQVDSMLTEAEYNRLPSEDESDLIRQYFFRSTLEGYERLLGQRSRWVRQWEDCDALRNVLSVAWSDPVCVESMFNVDVLVVRNAALWRQVPGRDGLIFEQKLGAKELEHLSKATAGQVGTADLEWIVFVVGAFARSSFIYGNLTYRAVALSAGCVTGALMRAALSCGMNAMVIDRFIDFHVNSALANDGVDRGAVVLVRVVPGTASADSEARGDKKAYGSGVA